MEPIKNRYEFVMLFDVENGNPNGDPDAGNMPRIDAETGYGIVSDVCLKRKIRNYVDVVKEGEPGYQILVKTDCALNDKFKQAYVELGQKKVDKTSEMAARDYICSNYYDVRTFGAVMSTGDNPCGVVRGPVQINFAKSINPVFAQELTITRQAITTPADFNKMENKNTMGKKNIISYGLYRAEGYVSACLAQKVTGFSEEDLNLLWESIINMFEVDHSAARGKMCMRKLYVFKHDNELGRCPSYKLFDLIHVSQKTNIQYPRSMTDFDIDVDTNIPEGVILENKI